MFLFIIITVIFDVHGYLEEFHSIASDSGFLREEMASVGGYQIPAYSRKIESGVCVYISSGCHGDEPAGPRALLELMHEGFFLEGINWLVCPLLNPTGMTVGARENMQGLDLNRDYLQRVSVEVRGHVSWLDSQPVPDVFLSLHEDWESTGFYLYEIQKDICQSVADKVLTEVESVIPREPCDTIDGHQVRQPGWIFHSPEPDSPGQWPEAIFMAERGTPVSYTLETPSSLELGCRVRCHKLAVQCAVRELLLTCGGGDGSNPPS